MDISQKETNDGHCRDLVSDMGREYLGRNGKLIQINHQVVATNGVLVVCPNCEWEKPYQTT